MHFHAVLYRAEKRILRHHRRTTIVKLLSINTLTATRANDVYVCLTVRMRSAIRLYISHLIHSLILSMKECELDDE